jgi:hypothetical protein
MNEILCVFLVVAIITFLVVARLRAIDESDIDYR